MRIKQIRAACVDLVPRPQTPPRVAAGTDSHFHRPLDRYPEASRAAASALALAGS